MSASYPTYKSTSIPWLPEIPEHWELRRNKYLLKEINERSLDGEEELLSVSQYTGVTLKRDRLENEGDLLTTASTLVGYKLVQKNDLVINIMLAWNGSLGVSDYNGIVSPAYCVYRFGKNINPKYYHYLFKTDFMKLYFRSVSSGVIESRLRMYTDDFYRLYSFHPPFPEQTAIANYLDAKTEQINRFIEKKEKLIALLKEQKQAVINELLKDKEGKWERKKLKYCVTKVGSGITPSGGATVYKDSGIPLLRSQNIHNDRLELDDVAFITQDVHDSMSGSKVLPGDVLLNITGGSLGRCFYATGELGEANVNQHVSIIRPHPKKIKTEFLQLLLISEIGRKQIWREQTGSGREGLNGGAIKNFVFPIPSIQSQVDVVDNIRKETNSTDIAISRIEKEIEKVKELKQSLIAEVVTGRIKVA